jgi:hypothetical protein
LSREYWVPMMMTTPRASSHEDQLMLEKETRKKSLQS